MLRSNFLFYKRLITVWCNKMFAQVLSRAFARVFAPCNWSLMSNFVSTLARLLNFVVMQNARNGGRLLVGYRIMRAVVGSRSLTHARDVGSQPAWIHDVIDTSWLLSTRIKSIWHAMRILGRSVGWHIRTLLPTPRNLTIETSGAQFTPAMHRISQGPWNR